jgi:TolB protein
MMIKTSLAALGLLASLVWPSAQQPPQPQTPAPQQPSEISTTISGEAGAPPRLAVPDFISITKDKETTDIAKTIGQVLWDDLNFEREFSFIPRDVMATVPAATSFNDIPFDRWRELNADGLIVGTVEKAAGGLKVTMGLYNVRTRQVAYGRREYSGSNARLIAHTISDEIHQTQRALRGVARTKLTFVSDRDGERMSRTVEKRDVKEIYISDYDGENQRRVTVARTLNITPAWSPDARAIAYTSYLHGLPSIFVSRIYEGLLEDLTKGSTGQNWLPAWSPDGQRICFSSTRGGGPSQLYVMNRDGSNVRRITNDRWVNITPTWSPSGNEIAFVSDRTGSPQIYVMSADGVGAAQRISTSEGYADRPAWSPPPFNEIAYAARTGPGNDIKVIDMVTRQVRQLTFGEGTNESPTWAANGRHLAFWSSRAGKAQIFTIAKDGRNLKQITKLGNNQQPDWSR